MTDDGPLLFDLCAVSELIDTRRDPGFEWWMRGIEPARITLSVMAVAAAHHAILRLPAIRRPAALPEAWEAFCERVTVLEVDGRIARRMGALRAGRGMTVSDAATAATAIVHDLPLVTLKDRFDGLDLRIIDPWNHGG